jgi:hypothetical protein
MAESVAYAPASPPVITDKTLRLFAAEIKAMSKAMAAWEPVVEDAARKQGRGPVTLRLDIAEVDLCQHRDRARPEHQV